MGEKTEKATPKKLKDARKKGQVAKSQDLPAAFTFIGSVAITLALSASLYHQLSDFVLLAFNSVSKDDILEAVLQLFYQSIHVIFLASIPILGLVALLGVVINFLVVGPMFSTEILKIDFKKLNPIDNLKAKFKLKTLVELLKSLIKIFVAGYLIYLVMYDSIPVLIQTVGMPANKFILVFYYFLLEVIIKVGLFFIGVAVLDFMYQKYTFSKEMRMEKFEVKQEYKNTEGDPLIKGKRRQIAQEIAYQEGPTRGIRKAQAVVTNPVHVAIALAYDREIDPAPYIVAMGKEILANRIVEIAKKYDIPVIQNIALAHELWENGDINEYIPENTYDLFITVLDAIAKLRQVD